MRNIAVFMDRDGTIDEEVGYITHPDQLRLLPRVASAIRRINQSQLLSVVITNQAGVAKGYLSLETLFEIHERLKKLLRDEGAYLNGIYYCPHHPDFGGRCNCRKPETGMFTQASQDLSIDLSQSFMVGDKLSDIEAANKVGAKGILVLTGFGRAAVENGEPPYILQDLWEATDFILQSLKKL